MSSYEEWREQVEKETLQRADDQRTLSQAAEDVYCSTEFLVGAPIKDPNGSYWYKSAHYIYTKLKEAATLPSSVDISAEVELAERILRVREEW